MSIITATAGSGNWGRDLTVTAVDSNGVTLFVSQVTKIEYRQVTIDVTKVLLNSHVIVADIPKTWEGTIDMIRGKAGDGDPVNLDKAINDIENKWFDQVQADFTLGTLVLQITSGTGNATITFLDASYRLEDGGTWMAEEMTTQKLAFRAARRRVG